MIRYFRLKLFILTIIFTLCPRMNNLVTGDEVRLKMPVRLMTSVFATVQYVSLNRDVMSTTAQSLSDRVMMSTPARCPNRSSC
jgi:hypothetical protein